MIENPSEMIDMQISHSQFHIYSGPFREANCEWGSGNVDQGAVIHKSHLIFDPIIQEAFKARTYIKIARQYAPHPDAMRSIVANLCVIKQAVSLFSAPGSHHLKTKFESENYATYFEECESNDVDEIFFIITFVKHKGLVEPRYLKDDSWGGVEGKRLKLGRF